MWVLVLRVVVVLQVLVPAVEGFGQGRAFHLKGHPGTAGTRGHVVTVAQKFRTSLLNIKQLVRKILACSLKICFIL